MKKLILILLITHCSLLIAEGQWIQQDSLVNYPYFNVKFINKNTGWISGHNGTIVKTTNSGLTWTIQKFIQGKLMYGLHPVDSNLVYAVGWFETILKTTNGGTNWIEIQNGPGT